MLRTGTKRNYRKRGLFRRVFFDSFKKHEASERPDYTLLISTACLIVLGLLMLSSATSVVAFDRYGDSYALVKQQFFHGITPGIIFLLIAIKIKYTVFDRLSFFIFLGLCILLLAVFIPGFGVIQNNSRSWIELFSTRLQTSEFAKLAFVLYLAAWFSKRQLSIQSFKKTTLPFLIITGVTCLLIMMQPDLGTMAIFAAVACILFFSAGGKISHLALIGLAGLLSAVPLIFKNQYRIDRILTFWDPMHDIQGASYQVYQGLLALGSGSWWGAGIGQSRQKFAYIPEIASDSIFAVIGEELGFVVSAGIIVLYLLILFRGFAIARKAPDMFGMLTAIGITSILGIHVLINIGAILALMPLTGVPLPFISLGGSNMVMLLAGVGILANISKYKINA